MKYDSIIVLSHELELDRRLSDESERRVDEGIGLFNDGKAEYIIMNSGPGKFTDKTFVLRCTHPVQCEVMREYALNDEILKKFDLSHEVLKDKILMQDYSSDTVGEAYFVKQIFLEPRKWYKNIVVTSEHHKERAEYIYEKILGPKYLTAFEVINFKLNEKEINEKERLKKFIDQFGEIEPGNSYVIEAILYSKHEIYSRIPKCMKLEYY